MKDQKLIKEAQYNQETYKSTFFFFTSTILINKSHSENPMKALILAAGFSTRHSVNNIPKLLLDIEPRKPALSYHIQALEQIPEITEIIITTNNKHYPLIRKWAHTLKSKKRITITNNGANNNEERLGSVNDILFAYHQLKTNETFLIIQGDEFFIDLSFQKIINKYKQLNKSIVVCARRSKEDIKGRFGAVEVDENYKIINVEEKPLEPKTELTNDGIYIFTKNDMELIEQMGHEIRTKLKPYEHLILDRTGDFFAWACNKTELYVYEIPHYQWLDTGKPEELKQAKKYLKKLKFT